jgi:cystathionine beta-lyase family protein involved in aluminum resistance
VKIIISEAAFIRPSTVAGKHCISITLFVRRTVAMVGVVPL